MSPIAAALDVLELLPGVRFENLTMFPLCGATEGDRDYLTLDEALAANTARVTEVSEGGSVPELRFENRGEKAVLLLDGEELVGAKQNRILNLTILVAAHSTIKIPVSCVEAGRWSYRSADFAAAPRAHYAEGRARKAAQVSASLYTHRSRAADQGDVWSGIAAKAERLAAHSPTGAMAEIFERHSRSVEDYVANLAPAPDQRGAVFAIESRIVGLDLFDHTHTLRLLLPKLVRSYALDAIDPATGRGAGGGPSREAAWAFLRRLSEADPRPFPAIGAGEDVRLFAEGLAGGGLVLDGRVVHLCAFAVPDGETDGEGGWMARASARRRHWARE